MAAFWRAIAALRMDHLSAGPIKDFSPIWDLTLRTCLGFPKEDFSDLIADVTQVRIRMPGGCPV
jgi:hypothetical protein